MPDCNYGIRVKFMGGAVFREYGYEMLSLLGYMKNGLNVMHICISEL